MSRVIHVLVAAAFLANCSGPYSNTPVAAKEPQPAAEVSVIRIAATAIPDVVMANGELFAEELANVTTKVPGRVIKMNVDLGSLVREGEIIAELDKSDYEFRAQQAAALVEQTRRTSPPPRGAWSVW